MLGATLVDLFREIYVTTGEESFPLALSGSYQETYKQEVITYSEPLFPQLLHCCRIYTLKSMLHLLVHASSGLCMITCDVYIVMEKWHLCLIYSLHIKGLYKLEWRCAYTPNAS